ncbi:MAG: protein-L-isoaspartate(D-aspartate) O-methyltransferase [Xanthomonadaceae bacterium]|nr:protein-L-isoaspartate(D-aspartate) O-methyltransferase [Xanthomonadaceae bacterium]
MTTIDYAKVRETMVEQQVRPWDVLDDRVLDVLSAIPRDAFIPAAYRALAYADLPIPIGHGEWMLKPVVEGRMLQSLAIEPTDAVLEVGTGSGFITACLGRLARDVLSLEINADLAQGARTRLAELGMDHNVRIETVDALQYDSSERFDAICISGAVATLPPRFLQWLHPGGRLFVVRGHAPAMAAELVRNTADGLRTESLFETVIPYLEGAAPTPEFPF